MIFKLDYLELPSSNGDATSRFLAEAFGWERITYGPEYSGASGAGIDIGVDSSAERVPVPLPVIRTDDLDTAEARVRKAGGVVTRAQFDFPGGRRFHAREPGGTEFAVYVDREAD
ncbi:bleomycin resistance protein [Devosia pacifica]|uniref:Bleomycin resistance protein n=1 Tax=Devosia pacifica TaxID=1335967 RepID=A0A918SF47_9HYPH|nr:VOC family protein [Devosia pacifica]GHA37731.1 bleomycin resistance protein [Devosia pacifica]